MNPTAIVGSLPGLLPGPAGLAAMVPRLPSMAKSNGLDTPVMRQYLDTKALNPDALLFMRMGDFYELFCDDAVEAARLLGLTLTSRNKGAPDEIPMAGVPKHCLGQYLPRLMAAGRKVAVMEQLEDPAKAKGIVKRGLTRVITSGTLIEEDELPPTESRPLVALTALEGPIGIAALDLAAGRLSVEHAANRQALTMALARMQPAEILLPEEIAKAPGTAALLASLLETATPPPMASLSAFAWKEADAWHALPKALGVTSLDGFGIQASDGALVAAASAALRYAQQMAGGEHRHLRTLTRIEGSGHLVIDARSRRSLELVRGGREGQREGSLLAVVDKTTTAPGSRLLADWLVQPLCNLSAIAARHDAVELLLGDDVLREDLRTRLKEAYDLERLTGRLGSGRANARDLVQLAITLESAAACKGILHNRPLPELLQHAVSQLDAAPFWRSRLRAMLVEAPPLVQSEGGLIRDGVDPELDGYRSLERDAASWLADYQVREAQASGLPRIKVDYNRVFGYYIELGRAAAQNAPAHFVRKQTLTNCERYITPELKDFEDKALHASERAKRREEEIFLMLRQEGLEHLGPIQDCARALAVLDVLAALAEVARRSEWRRPILSNDTTLNLQANRHPVVEAAIGASHFVANDLHLDGQSGPRLAVLTGPNMAGKSTFIRQIALAVVLAQCGSFVPAQHAEIGLVDRLFTRIGAGDELSRGLSTFMVEMTETANILHHATARSLVILDEVGRGTSTFDGLSLAWAITEYLHDTTRCRTLFATHYHELTDLAQDRAGIINLTVEVAEQDDTVVFLHRIRPGFAAQSYGIHVARLAGVPRPVLRRAKKVLSTLEDLNVALTQRERSEEGSQGAMQLTLFEQPVSPTLGRLRTLELDALSPKDALDLLYQLRRDARMEG